MSEPHPVDIHVGKRIRKLRELRGFSQEKLAEALGITFQQIQKYENGTNRAGASRLYQLGKALNVAPAVFFEGYPPCVRQPNSGERDILSLSDLEGRDALRLVRAFVSIEDDTTRMRVLKLTEAVAELNASKSGGGKPSP